MEVDAFFRDGEASRKSPAMFGEVSHFLLTGSVDHENGRFTPVLSQVGRVPTKVKMDVEHEVLFVRVGHTVLAQHGALVNEDVR